MTEPIRSERDVFLRLLFAGQCVDWRHSLVVVLVVTGLFATPLALGSIRNRVYWAVKAQVERENNAREIRLTAQHEEAPPLDAARIAKLGKVSPGLVVVGNHKLMVSVEGPAGRDFLTLEVLFPDDPRSAWLGIAPAVPASFGVGEVVVSDTLGRHLYGNEAWQQAQERLETLTPLTLSINEHPLSGSFQVVARRTLPGKGLYVSAEVGAGLRRYTRGFGAAELGLPLDEGLVEHALPRLATSSCWLVLPADACRGGDPARLRTRLAEVGVKVGERLGPILPLEPSFEALGLHLTEVVDEAGSNRVRELRSDCDGLLAPHLAAHCSEALALPELALEVGWEGAGRAGTTWLRGLPRPLRLELQGAQELASRLGVAPSTPGLAFDLAVPEAWGLAVGQSLLLKLAGQGLPARVQSLYRCPPSSPCGAFAEPMAVFRAQNLQAGLVRVHAVEPLALVPSYDGQDFDELLAYVPSVEQLEAVAARLRAAEPRYAVQYNAAALDRLRRQDQRLATLFSLTMALSAVFLLLAISALARINVERRSRQIAQLLVLGFSRRFVRALVVVESMLLTLVAALSAAGLTALLCGAARALLRRTAGGDRASQDFLVIVEAMRVDPQAFGLVLTVVAACTGLIALAAARRAAQSDPLTLMD